MQSSIRFVCCAMACLALGLVQAQSVHPDIPDRDVTRIGKELDKRQFDAFNQCNLEALANMYAPDVEFYHDLNGRILNRDQFVAAVKRNICGKAQRRLIESSLEVYPMAKVGLVVTGKHCFFLVGETQCIQSGRFYMLWRYDGKDWHLTRVFSYDHQDIK